MAARPGHAAVALEDGRPRLLDLEEQRVVLVTPEQQHDQAAGADAADADDLVRDVDHAEPLEQVPAIQASLQRARAWAFVRLAAMLALLHTQTPLSATLHGMGSSRGPAGQRQDTLVVLTGVPAPVLQGQHSVLVVQALPRL